MCWNRAAPKTVVKQKDRKEQGKTLALGPYCLAPYFTSEASPPNVLTPHKTGLSQQKTHELCGWREVFDVQTKASLK